MLIFMLMGLFQFPQEHFLALISFPTRGRAIRYNKRFIKDKHYMGFQILVDNRKYGQQRLYLLQGTNGVGEVDQDAFAQSRSSVLCDGDQY